MVSTLFSALVLVAGHLSLSTAQANPAFVGSGYIHVLNGSDITKASVTDRIGCMDKTGAFTLSDCAVFTRSNSGLFSSEGNCTFHDPSQPENLDSAYGRMSTAWHCTSGTTPYQDIYYSFTLSNNMPLICHGNLDCYLDVKGVAPQAGEKLPLWEYIWGSQQMGITPGHWQAMWLWEPVKSS